MKDLKYIIIIVILVSFITILFMRSCNVYDKYSELKGLYNERQAEAEKEKQEAEKVISEKKEEIVELQKKILSQNEIIDKAKEKAKVKDKETNKLEEERESLKDKDLIIVNQDKQIKAWKERLNLEREQKFAVITQRDYWKKAFYTQVDITEQIKKQLAREESLRKLGEERLALADKKMKRLRFGSNTKTILIAALGGYLGYKILK